MTNSTPPPGPQPPGTDPGGPGRQDDPPTPPATEAKPRILDLSLSQVVGGALAAMTAAALGSRLGVAGTIVGAALASIVAGVAGSLYTASLRRTREKVRTVWSGRAAGSRAAGSRAAGELEPPRPTTPATSVPRSRRLPWWSMLAATATILVLAVVALTGFEVLAGKALSGGRGTTIEQVAKHRAAGAPSSKKSRKPSTGKSTGKPSPTAGTSSAAPTDGSTEHPTGGSTETETASAAPTSAEPEQPSASATTSSGGSGSGSDTSKSETGPRSSAPAASATAAGSPTG